MPAYHTITVPWTPVEGQSVTKDESPVPAVQLGVALVATLANAPLHRLFGIPLNVAHYQGGSFRTHYHRFLELIVVNESRGSNVIDGKRTTFERAQVFRLGMFHPHRIEAAPGERCDYFNITFLPEALSGSGLGVNEMLRPFYDTAVNPPVLLSEASYREIGTLCRTIIEETELPDVQSPAIVLGAFRIIMGLVTRFAGTSNVRSDVRVQHALRIISERFGEPLETRELARMVDTSPSRLAQLFKDQTGTTIRQTLLRRRLTEAKRLLATTDTPVTDVLYEAGFNDVSYFNRCFRRDEGMTPREFRARARSEVRGEHKSAIL